jgi:hypothetical protein
VEKKLVNLTKYNAKTNFSKLPNRQVYLNFLTGRGVRPFGDWCQREGKFDLILSSPPYLPCAEEYDIASGLNTAVCGTILLEQLVTLGHQIAKRMYIQFSRIALPEFTAACEKAGVESRLIAKTKVPFRIPAVAPFHPEYDLGLAQKTENREAYEDADREYRRLMNYNKFLQTERHLEELNQRNFRWWHEIQIHEVRFSTGGEA